MERTLVPADSAPGTGRLACDLNLQAFDHLALF